MDVSVSSPAKLNLFLAVTGRRADGFHDLVSLVTPLTFGDELAVRLAPPSDGARFSLACDHPEVPVDGTNLVLRAAEAFAVAANWQGGAHFRLTKRIPVGAGLGGGSSNAAAALRALNRLAGGLLDDEQLAAVAATLGSDCVLFLRETSVIMRGRGERIEALPEPALARLRGRRVLLFKPSFGISTPWAYRRMIARRNDYVTAVAAEGRLAGWVGGVASVEELLFNNMEPAAFEKYVALPLLLQRLRRDFGAAVGMSGSGSACFALVKEESGDAAVAGMKQVIRDCWGSTTFVQDARLA